MTKKLFVEPLLFVLPIRPLYYVARLSLSRQCTARVDSVWKGRGKPNTPRSCATGDPYTVVCNTQSLQKIINYLIR